MRRIGFIYILLGSIALSLSVASSAEQEPPAEKKLPAELATLNKASLKMYAEARKQELSSISVVIMVAGDDLILLKKGQRTSVNVIGGEYHTLKSVAHTALGLTTCLAYATDRPLGEERRTALKEYQTLLTAVVPGLEKFGFDADTLARQKRILDRAQKLISKVLQDDKVTADDLSKFCHQARADLRANAEAAARVQLVATHKQVMAWKKEMTPEEWAELTAVVTYSGPTARLENAAVQYFGRLFGETAGEGRRVVYTESTYNEQQALNILGTLRLDNKVGSIVFGDNFRLYRDFMADGARSAIDDILAPP